MYYNRYGKRGSYEELEHYGPHPQVKELEKAKLRKEQKQQSRRKNQALRIVRTIGQAFEVCHKISMGANQTIDSDKRSHFSEDSDAEIKPVKDKIKEQGRKLPKRSPSLNSKGDNKMKAKQTSSAPQSPSIGEERSHNYSLTAQSYVQLLQEQIEQQQHHTQVAMAQVHLLKDQLAAETAARIETQARTHQLLMHNRNMLQHMTQLVAKIQELELKVTGCASSPDLLLPPLSQIQFQGFPDSTTPQCGPMFTPDHDSLMLAGMTNSSLDHKSDFDTESPDSGHKEMSPEALNLAHIKADGMFWQQFSSGANVSFSTPDNYIVDPVAQFADVTGNPFANGFHDDIPVNGLYSNGALEEQLKIVSSIPSQDASGKRLEPKSNKMPRIAPPPEFRNSASYRDSQISQQSTESTSSQETSVLFKGDSDYYSATASVTSSQNNDKGAYLQSLQSMISGNQNGLGTPQMNSLTASTSSQRSLVGGTSQMSSSLTSADFENSTDDHNIKNMHKLSLVKSSLRLELKKDGSPLRDGDPLADDKTRTDTSPKTGIRDNDDSCHIQEIQMKIKAPPPPPPPRRMDSIPYDNFEKV